MLIIDFERVSSAFCCASAASSSYNRFTAGKTRATIFALLLRAGSELPTMSPGDPLREDPYLSRILDAGGFKAYERAHLAALTNMLSPKLTHLLPPELVRKVVRLRVTPSTRRPLDGCDHAGRVLPARGVLPLHAGESPDRANRDQAYAVGPGVRSLGGIRSILCG